MFVGALRERFSAQRAVGVDLAVHDHGDVGAVFQKLHDVFSFSCHGGPARFCGGILFEAAEASFAKCKIDLLESSALGGFDGVDVLVHLHGCYVFDHGLAPDGEKNVFKRWGHAVDLSSDPIGKIGTICHRSAEGRRRRREKERNSKNKNDKPKELREDSPLGSRELAAMLRGEALGQTLLLAALREKA